MTWRRAQACGAPMRAALRPGSVRACAAAPQPLRAPAAFSALRRRAAPPLRAALDALCPLRGWADLDAVETRESPAHGRGVFALRPLRKGDVLGEYPGVVGGAVAVWDKCSAPRTAGALAYAFRCDSGRYIDPTDGNGELRASELAWWGPLSTDATLARINEPTAAVAGGPPPTRANVAAVEEPLPAGAAGGDDAKPDSLLVVVMTPVAAGEEILLSYGDTYDRSGYGEARS